MKPRIVVVGSLNADLVQRIDRLPRPGETLTGSELRIISGGKGANQAYAASLLGGRVSMLGQVGSDAFGPLLIASLERAGVDTANILAIEGATGTAGIFVLPAGENIIILSAGANGTLSPAAIREPLKTLAADSLLLVQLEVPLATTEFALRMARERGAITILDPAPAQTLPAKLCALVDYLTPNQTEAALLLGSTEEIESYERAEAAARKLLALGPQNVILKLGALGVVVANSRGCERVPGFPVQAVDTTAAGDTFNAAFAVALGEGKPPLAAARFANAAASISVTRPGAQSSIPQRAEVDQLLSVK
ncbi:MAG TPA: ribokinase [Bryobacteraceae bacterium]